AGLTLILGGVAALLAFLAQGAIDVSPFQILILVVLPLFLMSCAFLGVCGARGKPEAWRGVEAIVSQLLLGVATWFAFAAFFAPRLIAAWLKDAGWPLSLSISFVTVVLLIASWLRAERFVTVQWRRSSQDVAKPAVRAGEVMLAKSGPTGWSWLLGTTARWVMMIAALTTVLFFGMMSSFRLDVSTNSFAFMASQLGLMVTLMVCFRSLPQLRTFRVLPMKRQSIAAMFVVLPLGGLLVALSVVGAMISLISVFGEGSPERVTILPQVAPAFFAGSLVLATFPVILRWGPMLGTVVLIVAVVAGVMAREFIDLSDGVLWGASAAFILLSWWLVNRVLKSSAVWRHSMVTALNGMKR
ncbi:MAG: hypothetical protein AAF191_12780, partial [Verrucomicrobiota bacterium]